MPTIAARADQPAPQHVRAEITSCIPVGFGLSCNTTLHSPDAAYRGAATLEACVGNGDTIGLTARLEKAPLVGTVAPPLTLALDVVRADRSARYCGVLILRTGSHLRVVAALP